MAYGRQKAALPLSLRNGNTGQLGNALDYQDLGEAGVSRHSGTGNRPVPLFQLHNPVEQQKRVAVRQVVCGIGIKQGRLR